MKMMSEKTMKVQNHSRNRVVSGVLILVVLASSASVLFDWKLLPNYSSESAVSTIAVKEKAKENLNFDYDRESWEKNSPRIAVLVGPHKSGSTTIQTFFDALCHLKVHPDGRKPKIRPRYTESEWVWPKGEHTGDKSDSILSHYVTFRTDKHFKDWGKQSNEKREESRANFADSYRSIFRQQWEQGKKIIIASEEFDAVTEELSHDSIRAGNYSGEETHVAPRSGDMIDALLDLLPWENSTDTSTTIPPPLRLEEIEVQINYRTPRIDHLVSLWHQLDQNTNKMTLRQFLSTQGLSTHIHAIDSLAEAFQFVRKGIRTSIIDMKGFYENKNVNTKSIKMNKGTMVGGLQGVIACDILKMGTDSPVPGMYCENSSIFLPNRGWNWGWGWGWTKDKNQRNDKSPRKMTDAELHEIDLILEEYDCGVWKHLKKYQAQGLLRILHPGEHLFENCHPSSPDISQYETVKRISEIASRDFVG
mmetsp:Transcript_17272/g.43100  ORF Transcript_17272/g.43100 Transcript_17272/m.43100 type:complete len:476 (-) Transcript_17272:1052-2479(-)